MRLVRYGLLGVGSNIALYLLFLLLVWAGVAPIVASGLCYILGVAISYFGNRRWTFASRSRHSRDLPRFLLAYGVGMGVTLASMFILLRLLGPAVAQLLTIGIAALSIYVVLHILRFGEPA